ncbi:hypothetical protein C900_03904 [Fulvivirga imtechensis AK7]|uniref:Uncharacterized protein n=1 Tax=Fulvivirga imtechensis AK7 TaxID=1237149 RepID=L8JRX4_9BACT|nr:hypothetical protein C900_03904 [Fulvivirga imtechensis AK7]
MEGQVQAVCIRGSSIFFKFSHQLNGMVVLVGGVVQSSKYYAVG